MYDNSWDRGGGRYGYILFRPWARRGRCESRVGVDGALPVSLFLIQRGGRTGLTRLDMISGSPLRIHSLVPALNPDLSEAQVGFAFDSSFLSAPDLNLKRMPE
jgi:hypothetical protein